MNYGSIIVVGALALLAAGCGSSTGSPASAQPSGAVAFSRCIRAHGVPAYPDPSSSGLVPKETPEQLGVSPSAFQAAQKACVRLIPNRGQPTPAQVAAYRSVMLIYARCMRAHGVLNMPDPDSHGRLAIGPGTDVDVNSPQFQSAYQVCKSRLSP
jgi:hypothetical protein